MAYDRPPPRVGQRFSCAIPQKEKGRPEQRHRIFTWRTGVMIFLLLFLLTGFFDGGEAGGLVLWVYGFRFLVMFLLGYFFWDRAIPPAVFIYTTS